MIKITFRVLLVITCVVTLLFAGMLFLSFWGMPRIIKQQVHKQTELVKGTDQWDRFVDLPFPIDFSIRFFEVNNTEEVLHNKSKPLLRETEPYTYHMTINKQDIRLDDGDDDTVSYDRKFKFDFVDSGTTKETDNVTIVNPLLMAALQLISGVERIAFAGCIQHLLEPYGMGTVFITQPVGKLLFEGINFAYANDSNLGYACKVVRSKIQTIIQDIRVIEHVPGEGTGNDYFRFAVFNYKTDNYLKPSVDGYYTVNRGTKDMNKLGSIMRWNSRDNITTWGTSMSTNNDTCNKVRGTDSTIYHPFLENGDSIEVFNTDICRTVKLDYKGSGETYKGVEGYKYELSYDTFRPTTKNPENDCFCTKTTKDPMGQEYCYLDGVFDFKPCLGAPVLVSLPHFLDADKNYLDDVQGLKPDKEKHDIYLLLEPNTGTPLVGKKRIQLNIVLKSEPLISFITPVTMYEAVVPVLWLEESVLLPQKYVDMVKNQYFNKVKLADGLKYGFIAALAALLAVCVFFLVRKRYFNTSV